VVETLLSAVLTCVTALFLGQAALRLSGAGEWSWLAPPIGISIAMLIAVPAIHVPGRCATVAALLALLTIAAIAYCAKAPSQLPPLSGLVAVAPVAALVLVPFIAAGHGGILGTSLNNDMSIHLEIVESFLSEAAQAVYPLPLDYPLGPHAMVAVISKGAGVQPEYAFSGWTMALPLLSAWTGLALVQKAGWPARVLVATVVGMPFLVAAYYGEGSYKEVLQANLVLAVALLLSGYGSQLRFGRWVPLALLVAGIVSVYSVAGLPWPIVLCGLWLLGTGLLLVRSHGVRELAPRVRRSLPAAGIGLGVLVVVLIPQIPRLAQFISLREGVNGTGIVATDIGNLVGPLPGWEALGVWSNPDFRMPASPAFTAGMWTAFVLGLLLLGTYWAIRRGRWMLPAAATGSMLIWAFSTHSQSPYVTAKALVIASPLLLAVAVFPLVERGSRRPAWWSIAPLLGIVLFARVGFTDGRALRVSPVGPTSHPTQLESLRPLLAGQPTLFLGEDDFVKWELAGVPVSTAGFTGGAAEPIRAAKDWAPGEPIDFDTVDATALNRFDWFVTSRDAAGSAPPPQLRLVRKTESYEVWKRVGEVEERSVLPEGAMSGKVLDCGSAKGQAIFRRGGVAAVRPRPVVVAGAPVLPGETATVSMPLHPGTWDLTASYTSTFPVSTSFGERRATLPANLDRLGPRWPIGRLTVRGLNPTVLTFHIGKTVLTPDTAAAVFGNIVATPVARARIVSMHDACGMYVDWYRPAN
jgi:hypothetical protein